MKIIYRYLFKKFLGPFALTFFFALFILLMQFLWRYVDDLVGKGLELSIILEFLFYASAGMVAMAAPLAVLLSSLMTFGSLGESYELIAMKSAGVSLRKLIFSLSLFSILIAVGSFWFSDNVAPKAYYNLRTLLSSIVDKKPTLSIVEGTFYTGFDNYTIRVGKKDKNSVDIYDVLLFDHAKHQGNLTLTYAKRGKMEMTDDKMYMLFYLYDGFYWDESSNTEQADNNPLLRYTFSEQYKRFDISSFQFDRTQDDFYGNTNLTLTNKEIYKKIDTAKTTIAQHHEDRLDIFMNSCYHLKKFISSDSTLINKSDISAFSKKILTKKEKNEMLSRIIWIKNDFANGVTTNQEYTKYLYSDLAGYFVEWYKKYVFAVACLIFFFIGAPLGSIIRKGGIGVPLVITVAFFTVYFFISIFGEKIAKGEAVPVWFGMWLATFILIPICALLTYQASVDSALLSSEELYKKMQQFNLKKMLTKKKNESAATHP